MASEWTQDRPNVPCPKCGRPMWMTRTKPADGQPGEVVGYFCLPCSDPEGYERARQRLRSILADYGGSFEAAVEQVGQQLEEYSEALRAEYARAGSPYGAPHEGLMRWVRERGGEIQ